MNPVQNSYPSKFQRLLICVGTILLMIATFMLITTLVGITELRDFEFAGHSGIRTIAAVAVAGCLFSAIGFFDEYKETDRDQTI